GKGDVLIVERHIWNDDDGGVTMVVWTRNTTRPTDGKKATGRWSHLVRSTDGGKTWKYMATIGPGGEPAWRDFHRPR
ncbi:MAG TPA: hypothetical protein VHV77_13920, partial [Pirellulales bacterium]|nr:hypothetical protein [Pirellulales bacterium]